MNDTEKELLESLRVTNHNLISANHQLHVMVCKMVEQVVERERYVLYLENIIFENGWRPGQEKSC